MSYAGSELLCLNRSECKIDCMYLGTCRDCDKIDKSESDKMWTATKGQRIINQSRCFFAATKWKILLAQYFCLITAWIKGFIHNSKHSQCFGNSNYAFHTCIQLYLCVVDNLYVQYRLPFITSRLKKFE